MNHFDLTSTAVTFLMTLSLFYVGSQLLAIVLLAWCRRRLSRQASLRSRLGNAEYFPPISIITSLKGPTPGAPQSVKSLLLQDYPGKVEIIFATLDDQEPLIKEVQQVIAENPSRHEVRWVNPVNVEDLNPRTAKINQAYLAARYPWIFLTCVDTRFSPGYLRKSIELTELREERYVTSFPVIDSPTSFPARMEAVGLNVDVSQYFMFSMLSAKSACAYGGALLFSRKFAEKCGAYVPLLKLLADDVTLANALTKVGGVYCLTDELAYVHQEQQSLPQYWNRQVRWRMIGKYFTKGIFWLAPLSWVQLYLLVGFFFTHDLVLLLAFISVVLTRIVVGYSAQVILETPKRDHRHAWILPIYDWTSIVTWSAAVLKNSISWGPTLMYLDRNGAVYRSVKLDD